MKTIITHPNFDYLGDQISRDNGIQKAKVNFSNFSDGWPNIFIENVKESIEHKEVTYIGDFSKPEDLFANFSLIRGVLDYYPNKMRIIFPYFPVGTMERIDTKGQIATARYYADIMSQFPSGREGKTSIHIFDIHALVERFLFNPHNVNIELHTTMSLLREKVARKTIVFPDDGAIKRFGNDFPGFDIVLCSKVREGDKKIISLKEGNPKGKDVIIVDDLILGGGTIKETAQKLRELGAKSITSYVTHGFFAKNSHLELSKYLDKLIVTDTIPANIGRAKEISNMEVLSMKILIEKIMFHRD